MALCIVMALGILAGCGQKGNDPPKNDDNSTALSGSVSTNGSTSMDKVIGALKEQFTADNPGVTVTYDPTGSGAGIEAVKNAVNIPFVADIHFDYRLALECVRQGVDKIRINPGNIGSAEKVRAVADACRDRGIPIRIGVNGGSLERELLQKYGGVTAQALVDSALGHVRLLNDCNFDDICISVKCSHVPVNMAAYRMLHEQTHYPLHLGVTEAGTPRLGVLKSAIGIGGLLCEGIGDTMRVSLTADPVEEIYAAKRILQACGIRRSGVNLVSCPTCGRTAYDLSLIHI